MSHTENLSDTKMKTETAFNIEELYANDHPSFGAVNLDALQIPGIPQIDNQATVAATTGNETS